MGDGAEAGSFDMPQRPARAVALAGSTAGSSTASVPASNRAVEGRLAPPNDSRMRLPSSVDTVQIDRNAVKLPVRSSVTLNSAAPTAPEKAMEPTTNPSTVLYTSSLKCLITRYAATSPSAPSATPSASTASTNSAVVDAPAARIARPTPGTP